MSLKRLLPKKLKVGLRKLEKTWVYFGDARFCPVCSHSASRFEAFGVVKREDARCVWCGALERHRLAWLFLERKTDFFSERPSRQMLHFAPEGCFENRFREKIGKGYKTADLNSRNVDVNCDITCIPFPDSFFDIIYCSHVLEHVGNDNLALAEIRRVLKAEGCVMLAVPITAERTSEDRLETDPRERLRRFGQEDHVRVYGPDFLERVEVEGLKVDRVAPDMIATADEREYMGITAAAGDIFYCRKESLRLT